jgi:hypothetical protein
VMTASPRRKPPVHLVAAAIAAAAGCSTLGPVPVATGISPVPRGRFDAEVQVGAMPGYYLSSATVGSPRGAGIAQLSGVIEPGVVPGLVVGGRILGPGYDTQADPLIGYRRALRPDHGMSLAIVGFGTHKRSAHRGASYTATRAGAELGADFRLGRPRPWIEPHVDVSISATGFSATGDYCTDAMGRYGVDCPDPPTSPPAPTTRAHAAGLYPAVTAGASLVVGHHHASVLHGARALILVAGGTMPRVIGGVQATQQPYFAVGLALSLSLGAAR